MKRFFYASILMAISLALSIATIEAALRLAERRAVARMRDAEAYGNVARSDIPGLYYTLLPHHRHGEIVFNSHGFNMPERPAEKPPGVRRIFITGDSVAQGVGIERTDQAMPVVLEHLLHQRGISPRVEIWNAGTGGYNAEQVRIQTTEILPRFQPDAIVYVFNFNDYWDPNRYFYGQPATFPSSNQASGLLDRLKRLRIVLRARDAWNKLLARIRGYPPVYVDYKIGYPSWQAMKRSIREMNAWCAARGIPFAVAVHPNLQFLHRTPTQNRAHADILAFLDAEQIAHLDLLPCFRPHRREPIYLPDGNHMRPEGYRRMAECIADWLLSAESPIAGILNNPDAGDAP